MRAAVFTTLILTLSLHLSANTGISTSPLPAWLYDVHPDLGKTPPKGDIANGYFYELIDLQSNLLRNTEYTHYIKVISNGSGVQEGSEVSVTFAPQFQKVVFHRIDIIRDGAVLNQLQPGLIKVVQEETDAGEFQYNGLKRAFLTLKDVRKGDRIDVAFSVVGFNPVFGNKYSDEFSFNSPTAVCNYDKTIITTTARSLTIRTVNNAPMPAELTMGNTVVYCWANPELSSDESTSDAPSWYNSYPTIFVTEFPTWQSVVDWGLTTFDHYHFPLPVSLQQTVAGWQTLAKGDKDLFASLATRFVQDEVRYLGLEIGVNTHQPHPPGQVFDQRFGDCKDKALLLASILQQADIPAFVALVNTEKCGQLSTVAPSPEAFDHAIVAIRQPAGNYTFIDPTRSQQRGKLADLFIPAYGNALVLREGETALQPLTPGRINDYEITESLDAQQYDTALFSVNSVYSGGAADEVRSLFAESSRKNLRERYRKYYATLFGDIRPKDDIIYTDDSLKDLVAVRKQFSVPQWWNTGKNGKKYLDYAVQIIQQNLPDPADAPDDAPLALSYPFNASYTLELSLPEGWDFGAGELHLKNDAYSFDFVPVTDGNHVTLHYGLHTFTDHITAAALREYREDYKTMQDKISFRLYKDVSADASAPAKDWRDWKVCWPSIWLTFFFCLLFSRLFHFLNTRSAETHLSAPPLSATHKSAPGSGYPLGGWLILLGIHTGCVLLLELTNFLQAGYYSRDNWAAYGIAGGAPLQYLLMLQLAVRLSFIACGGAILFWFLRKRDIFPRMFLWYIGILLTGRLLLMILFYTLPMPPAFDSNRSDLTFAFVGSCIYAAVWATYITRSDQVKSTFLEPFRERIR
jgi:hypothetical protein